MASYISDGFNLDGYIAASVPEESGERLYDALTFSYRPATRLDCVKVDQEIAIAGKNRDVDAEAAVKAERVVCKFVADRIVSWDLVEIGVHPVAVSATSCERIHPFLFSSLYRIIRGTQASDKKPEEKKAHPTDAEQVKN
jgi:hypothetical protein